MRARRLVDQVSRPAVLALVALLPAACAVITGLDEFEVDGSSGRTDACTPGVLEACYTGPDGTHDVGICHSGSRTCDTTGHWRACEGEVLPVEEDCATPDDEDCDGAGSFDTGDADCLCQPGTTHECDYTGPPGTEGVGICKSGTGTCNADGRSLADCQGEVLPAAMDICTNDATDDNCDGAPCPGDVLWALAASGNGFQSVNDMVVDSNGNLIVLGGFIGVLTVGTTTLTSQTPDAFDAFILKLSSDGQLAWARQFGSALDQRAVTVAVDTSSNIYVAGDFEGDLSVAQTMLSTTGDGDFDLFVLKLSSEGNPLWAKDYGDDRNQFAGGVAVTEQGGVVLTGRFNGHLDFDATGLDSSSDNSGDFDLYLAHLDTDGVHIWSKSFGDNKFQNGSSVAISTHVYVTGYFNGDIDSGAGSLYGGNYYDVLAMRRDLASSGPGWAKSFADVAPVHQKGFDISLDSNSNVLVTGEFGDTINFSSESSDALTTFASPAGFVAKLSSEGGHIWSKAFGSSGGSAHGRSVATDTAGNVLITGEFQGSADFGGDNLTSSGVDLVVAKLAPDGTHIWSRRFGDDAPQVGTAIAADSSGDVLVTGTFQGSMVLGNTTVTANNSGADQTLFIAKLAR